MLRGAYTALLSMPNMQQERAKHGDQLWASQAIDQYATYAFSSAGYEGFGLL